MMAMTIVKGSWRRAGAGLRAGPGVPARHRPPVGPGVPVARRPADTVPGSPGAVGRDRERLGPDRPGRAPAARDPVDPVGPLDGPGRRAAWVVDGANPA